MRDLRRSEKSFPIMERLVHGTATREGKIFSTFRELMCFLAVLGFEHDIRIPIGADYEPLETRRVFDSHDPFLDLMYLLALAETKEGEILLPKEENEELCLRIFEEYAEGGMDVLQRWFHETPDDPYGDRAILAALRKYGYLEQRAEDADPVAEVEF